MQSAMAVSRLKCVARLPLRTGPWLDRRGPTLLALLQVAVYHPDVPDQLQKLVLEPLMSLCRVRQPDPVPRCLMHIEALLWLAQEARMALCWARAGLMRGWAAIGG